MARCEECLHYPVCAKECRLAQIDEHTWDNYNQLDDVEKFCDNYISTADVVAKSEADKLIGKFECFLCHVTGSRLSKHTYDLRTMETVATDCINEAYNDGYGEGYKECAREIFEEIESISYDFPIYGNVNTVILSERDLAFIKKKYTEETE